MKTTRLSLYRNENGKVDLQSCYEEKETKNDDLSYPYYEKIDCIHSKCEKNIIAMIALILLLSVCVIMRM